MSMKKQMRKELDSIRERLSQIHYDMVSTVEYSGCGRETPLIAIYELGHRDMLESVINELDEMVESDDDD